MKFIKLHVSDKDKNVIAERYVRLDRITEIRVLKLSNLRYEVVLDNGEKAILEWENVDQNEALIALMG